MPHEAALIGTIAVSLAFAFIGGFVAVQLRLPPLVGYLLAGIAVGAFTPGFVADRHLAPQLAEIGVILLMFGVGLHFSVRDLLAVRGVAVPGAIVQIMVATGLGVGVAYWWGWSTSSGFVFGLALSVASTVVLLRALEARGHLSSDEGRIAVGWLIVEDLVMVVALVLLPALAGPLQGAGTGSGHAAASTLWATLGLTLGKIAAFIGLMLVAGTRIFPRLLIHVERTGSRELFTLAVVALALGLAFAAAELFGVSFALGAFFSGVVINQSDLSHRAATDSQPLQDVFAALFFVAVGMLFDPRILVQRPVEVISVLAIIIFGKSLAAFGIVLALGYPRREALTVAAALSQIGEFSFILAELGMSLHLLSAEAYSLILAGSIFSIAVNPLGFAAVSSLRTSRGRLQPAS